MSGTDLAVKSAPVSALLLSPERMNNLIAFADIMSEGRVMVPKHLHGQRADCLAIAMQATEWGMNPFSVAQKTHVVSGTLGYEAQLVNAVVQASGAITGRFHYEYRGAGNALECRAGAIPAGETELVWCEWLAASSVTTKNSPLWKTNPAQQMAYLQVKNWARVYAPGAILGVYSSDELEERFTPHVTATAEPAPKVAAKVEPPELDAETFAGKLETWAKLVLEGYGKTPPGAPMHEKLLADMSAKYKLSDEQLEQMNALYVAPKDDVIEGELL